MLAVGDQAPGFSLKDGTGKTTSLADQRGQKVVLYFYPKDMTPGCTQEACDFRDLYSDIQQAGAALFGVSPDDEKSHQKFTSAHSLPFPLLADPGHVVAEAYGVWQEKSNYGKTYMGIVRTTFLIDESGKLEKIWPRVKVEGHGDAVLAAVRK